MRSPRREPLLRDVAYERLSQAILTGELPPGEILRYQDLAAQLGMSRVPVREAITLLASQGLVEVKAQSFTQVAPIDVVRCRQSVPVLCALRVAAARSAALRITPRQVDQLRQISETFGQVLRRAALEGAHSQLMNTGLDATRQFHAIYVDVVDNPILTQMISMVEPYIYRALRLRYFEAALIDAPTAAGLREDLLDAFMRRDPEGAEISTSTTFAFLSSIFN